MICPLNTSVVALRCIIFAECEKMAGWGPNANHYPAQLAWDPLTKVIVIIYDCGCASLIATDAVALSVHEAIERAAAYVESSAIYRNVRFEEGDVHDSWNYHITRQLPVVADSWPQLRKSDVYRFINLFNVDEHGAVGASILLQRPDLIAEVDSAIVDLFAEATAVTR